MAIYLTKVSAKGQVCVPSELREKHEIAEGTLLEWTTEGDKMVVQRRKLCTTQDIRDFLESRGKLAHRTDGEIAAGVTRGLREKYARSR